jgi:hypothetical protein
VTEIRDEFLSEEDLDLDEALYSHGVFDRDPAVALPGRGDFPGSPR